MKAKTYDQGAANERRAFTAKIRRELKNRRHLSAQEALNDLLEWVTARREVDEQKLRA